MSPVSRNSLGVLLMTVCTDSPDFFESKSQPPPNSCFLKSMNNTTSRKTM